MSQDPNPPVISREDYEAIEAAVMETTRGRWFLAEYARRNRNADTTMLLDAIARLEKRLAPGDGGTLLLQRELTDMADTISQTKLDLAHSIVEATGLAADPDPARVYEEVLQASEKADSAVLNAAEHVQEIAWALREGADEGRAIEDLDRQALEIYRASNQHALTTSRVRSIVTMLREMETRLDTIVGSWRAELSFVGSGAGAAWGAHREAGRAGAGQNDRAIGSRERRYDPETVLDTAPSRIRDDIVFVDPPRVEERRSLASPPLVDVGGAAPPEPVAAKAPSEPAGAVPGEPAPDNPFAAIDALPDRRKLALFV